MSIFLGSHGLGLATVSVETSGLLNDLAASVKYLRLTLYLELDGAVDGLEGVYVLYLGSCTKLGIALSHKGNVNVRTDRALLHLTIGNACVLEKQRDRLNESSCFLGGGHIRLGNYLDKGNAAAVVVAEGNAVQVIVDKLACVLFKVDTVDPYLLVLLFAVLLVVNGNNAVDAQGKGHLGYLISLWKVGIEVVLSVENRELVDAAAQSVACSYSVFNSGLVYNGESTGHT